MLTVVTLVPDKKNPLAVCLCDCGSTTKTQRGALRSGKAKSCGCLTRRLFTERSRSRARLSDEEARMRSAAYTADWHRRHPEKVKAAARKFYLANKHKANEVWHRRRARLLSAQGVVSKGIRQKLMILQKGRCANCGCCVSIKSHLDHVVPLVLGGRHEDLNLQLLCVTCNLKKGGKDPLKFRQEQGFLL